MDESRPDGAWKATRQEIPAITVPALFERQVRQTPDTIAVIGGDWRLTYADLNRRANRLAHALIARGVGPERIAGIHIPRSIDMFVAILAVLKAGAAYLPLDCEYPAERVTFMANDATPDAVLCHGGSGAVIESPRPAATAPTRGRPAER